MLFAVRFEDDPARIDVRQREMAAHLAWLEAHANRILVAGSLRREPGAHAEGGLWIVEAEDRAAVEALVEEDPFWTAGLRAAVHIHHWSKAFEDRRVPV